MRRTAKQLDNIIQGSLEEHKRFRSSRKVNGQQDFIDTMLDILHVPQEKPSSFELDTIINATCLIMPFTLATLLQAFEIMTPSKKQDDPTERFGLMTMKDTPLEVMLTPRLPDELYSDE
ncbi:hypothetical protein Nepgr_031488 [Nepenthes gracilis]|uniref:Cytochrome P450 n=1 Tax=Nepenthes gracilis TaxID=150966 RepID=A0AAD3TGT9_NEPGR|nr:hypothetical protein Nepgr_031488 [Nepenthes gracilis]